MYMTYNKDHLYLKNTFLFILVTGGVVYNL